MSNIIKFYSHDESKFYHQFSNFYISPFEFFLPNFLQVDNFLKNKFYCESSEKAIMLSKAILMNDRDTFNIILKTKDPAECKLLGRKVNNFNQNLWDNHINEIAYNVLYQKFTSNDDLTQLLLNTNNNIIAEATENDNIWGIGLNINDSKVENPDEWLGKNILGYTLMNVRDTIKLNLNY
jgi:ribA/ribD-fused uncharacterized protein